MGQEVIIYLITHSTDAKPDWSAALGALERLEVGDAEREVLRADVETLRDAVEVGSRELVAIAIPGLQVYATGGPTWGDAPTELAESLERLVQYPQLCKAANFGLHA